MQVLINRFRNLKKRLKRRFSCFQRPPGGAAGAFRLQRRPLTFVCIYVHLSPRSIPPSWVPGTHMGALAPGTPVWVPIHSVLTLPPSVNSSPVCCSFANRTIQMVSSPPPPPHPLPLKDEGTVPVTSVPASGGPSHTGSLFYGTTGGPFTVTTESSWQGILGNRGFRFNKPRF